MLMKWEKDLDILGPIEQARRCLSLWLREEKRFLTDRQQQRAAALMARYFHHEDQVTDQLMLSFLRHYSGRHDVDMEDPASVRLEIKSVLDQSRPAEGGNRRVLAGYVAVALAVALGFGAWEVSHKTIDKGQQAELKSLVRQIDALDPNATAAGIWADMKEPLRVRSYQEIPWWRYGRSKKMLEERLAAASVEAGIR